MSLLNGFFSMQHFQDEFKINTPIFRGGLVGSSDCNAFFPAYALYAHQLLLFNEESDLKAAFQRELLSNFVIEYSAYNPSGTLNYSRQYEDLFAKLKNAIRVSRFLFKTNNIENTIYVSRGFLFAPDLSTLMSLAIRTEANVKIKKEGITKLLPADFVIFVQKDFNTNPLYKRVVKKVHEEYIQPLFDLGVDVIYTQDINNQLYKNNFKKPKFKTISALNEHLEWASKTLTIN